MVTFHLTIVLTCFISTTPFFVVLCRIIFKYNRGRGRLFFKRGKNDEDMATMLMSMSGAWIGEDGVHQGFPSQEGGLRLIRFESPRWRPKAIQVRAQFGVQEQCAIKRTPRSHTESVLDVLYMVGSTIS
jgi:hypothetical protein